MHLDKLVYSTALLLPTLFSSVAHADVYDRPILMTYARTGGKVFTEPGHTYSDAQLLKFFDEVKPNNLTAITPFLLNVLDASKYDSILQELRAREIEIIPAIGENPYNGAPPIDDKMYKQMASSASKYTTYISIENTQGFYDEGGAGPIQNIIDYCISIGYEHIMLNPVPRDQNGLISFKGAQIDSTIRQVILDFNRNTLRLNNDPDNWKVNTAYNQQVEELDPNLAILINYEDPKQEEVLQKQADQTGAMQVTINAIKASSTKLSWCPPFSTLYDPIAEGTWGWIAKQLGSM